jgi:hypothetical protein
MFEMGTGLRACEGIRIEDAITIFHLVVPWAFSPRINSVAKAGPSHRHSEVSNNGNVLLIPRGSCCHAMDPGLSPG